MRVRLPGRLVRRQGAPRGRRNRSPLAPARGATAAPPSDPLRGAQAAATTAPAQPTWSRALRPARCAARHKLPNAMRGAIPPTTRAEVQLERPWASGLRRGKAALPGLTCSISPGGRGRWCRPGNVAGGGVITSVRTDEKQSSTSCRLAASFRRRSRLIPYPEPRHGDA
ncbi:uncharacterized protein LOC143694186 [Agelaius phoeniceus]|uniref:uncharacterized protein LOC143694186 n=1 Tax=Agelaius phoeniceus TaxID=39638 RepID=UPI004054A0A5